ncbi:MAG: hypothetical protein IJU44_03945 [Kiritimatiellae bacterium]|nr:hypothetical protein [Kiritimatiellia bacterium]
MADGQNMDTEAYLARIRRTIAESERLVESARLRIAETDRMLEQQGLTREQVMNFRFSPEQREAVNRELARQGMEPLEEESLKVEGQLGYSGDPGRADLGPLTSSASSPDGELAERQRKFGMMMKPFQI